MSNPIAIAVSFAQRAAARAGLGETVFYHRGDERVELFDCIQRQPDNVIDDLGQSRISHEDVDWTIPADGLILGGTLATPAKGDRIETISGEIYQVLPRDRDECWRWGESLRVNFHVHTKRIG